MKQEYQICTRCIIDSRASDVTFDENGICNFCTEFLNNSSHILQKKSEDQKRELDAFIVKVKKNGKGKDYDCVVGVSGGVDSSWALVQAVKLGLRPLAVHMDNGWNSELAQNNIENLIRGLGLDLFTYVIDWEEYRSLMQAFFDADVIDIELLYDNAMGAVISKQASRHGLRYILTGVNKATEGILLPKDWVWNKLDKKNIVGIAKKFGNIKIKSFPAKGTWDWIWYHYIRFIQMTPFLDYFPYNKAESLKVLREEYGYKPYPYKHYESIFTRFYQGYILPHKFGVDKRMIHLATLVAAGQMKREDALKDLEKIPYPSEKDLQDDKEYFLKKMGWTEEQLTGYLKRPLVPHDAYPSERKFFELAANIPNLFPDSLRQSITKMVKSLR